MPIALLGLRVPDVIIRERYKLSGSLHANGVDITWLSKLGHK